MVRGPLPRAGASKKLGSVRQIQYFSARQSMINLRILNPRVLSLLARVRHTNALVIADRGFPFWPMIETVDISLVDGVPTVLQVLAAVRANGSYNQAFMAQEFQSSNPIATCTAFANGLSGMTTKFEP